MKQIFRLITCMAVCFLMCGLSSCEDQNKAQSDEVSSEVKLTTAELSQSIDTLQTKVNELQKESESAHTIAWIIAVTLILVVGGAAFLLWKQVTGLGKTCDKLQRKVDELDKKLESLEDKVQQNKSKVVSKTGTNHSAGSAIQNLQESFDSLDRRLKQLDATVIHLQTQLTAATAAWVQQAAPVATAATMASKVNRHGYFKIPIMGAEGAYFDQVAEEKSGAYFDVEYTDNSATFKPIAPYTQLNQNDYILDYAVELQGDQDNSQNYDCLAPGRAHLQGGRWVIDAKAKLKLY